MTYRHAQSAPLIAAGVTAVGVAVLALGAALAEPVLWISAVALLGIAALAYALSGLTTAVSPDRVTVAFRWGWPRRTIPCAQIAGVEIVRNTWWHGWGIRWIPGATMYNIWGLDAVHLELDGRRDFRIGTDDPEGLAAAIDVCTSSAR